ncbi:hypothetical protein EYC84_004270 [Monilinia fructicola]|uniref:Uncharacterized protein n=1 Tax=Monilinia fructicola TaxID=38448 RepID=A0A5M9K0K0_MONFR|nr:hypothetical protein EYC84_004270 [Monilinia fructicola]
MLNIMKKRYFQPSYIISLLIYTYTQINFTSSHLHLHLHVHPHPYSHPHLHLISSHKLEKNCHFILHPQIYSHFQIEHKRTSQSNPDQVSQGVVSCLSDIYRPTAFG